MGLIVLRTDSNAPTIPQFCDPIISFRTRRENPLQNRPRQRCGGPAYDDGRGAVLDAEIEELGRLRRLVVRDVVAVVCVRAGGAGTGYVVPLVRVRVRRLDLPPTHPHPRTRACLSARIISGSRTNHPPLSCSGVGQQHAGRKDGGEKLRQRITMSVVTPWDARYWTPPLATRIQNGAQQRYGRPAHDDGRGAVTWKRKYS